MRGTYIWQVIIAGCIADQVQVWTVSNAAISDLELHETLQYWRSAVQVLASGNSGGLLKFLRGALVGGVGPTHLFQWSASGAGWHSVRYIKSLRLFAWIGNIKREAPADSGYKKDPPKLKIHNSATHHKGNFPCLVHPQLLHCWARTRPLLG